MENIKKPSVSNLRTRWKTILALAIVASASFTAGTYGNRVFVGLIQSIAGNHVLVPPPELQIIQSTWSINSKTSLVTDVDLLVTTNSSVWQLKLYRVEVEVSCLKETPGTVPVEFICANGRATIILPTHGIGLRPIKILLNNPIDPEITEIHDLSIIVTDLARIPGQPPTIFGGPTAAEVTVAQGSSVRVAIEVVGVAGVAAGTQVTVESTGDPNGITETAPQTLILVGSPNNPGVVMADSFFDIFADASAQVGTYEVKIVTTGPRNDVALLWLHVIPNPVPQGGELPNLMFPNCPPPPSVNFLTDCLGTNADSTLVELVVKNNGPVATSVATTVLPSGDATCDALSNCIVPVLAPGAQTTVIVHCIVFNPDCNFGVTIDPPPPPLGLVVESSEFDNDMLGVVLG